MKGTPLLVSKVVCLNDDNRITLFIATPIEQRRTRKDFALLVNEFFNESVFDVSTKEVQTSLPVKGCLFPIDSKSKSPYILQLYLKARGGFVPFMIDECYQYRKDGYESMIEMVKESFVVKLL